MACEEKHLNFRVSLSITKDLYLHLAKSSTVSSKYLNNQKHFSFLYSLVLSLSLELVWSDHMC